jgi:hypothetical protein
MPSRIVRPHESSVTQTKPTWSGLPAGDTTGERLDSDPVFELHGPVLRGVQLERRGCA